MKSIRKSAKGFTFVELIVVMAVIAVLTATLVMAVGAFLRDKKYDDANAKAETIYRALQIKLNQYDAEGHMTMSTAGIEVEGIGGIPRKSTDDNDELPSENYYFYIGNFGEVDKDEETIGICSNIYVAGAASASPAGYHGSVQVDGSITDFYMGDTIKTIYTKRTNDNVDWNPSWMAKIDMETYTVKYVIYSEDKVERFDDGSKGFLDRCATDNTGYYVDIYEQQSSSERADRDQNVIGCYPMGAFYN